MFQKCKFQRRVENFFDSIITGLIREQLTLIMTDIEKPQSDPEMTPVDTGDIFAEVDKLIEADQAPKIVELSDDVSYVRIGLYLSSMASITAAPEEREKLLRVAFDIYMRFSDFVQALRLALKMNNNELIRNILNACKDVTVLKQLALIIARHRVPINFTEAISAPSCDTEELQRISSYELLCGQYKALATELDVVEPKTPEEIFKSHLEEGRRGGVTLDSAKQNLAASIVNAFVNIGFCADKLMITEDNNWLYKNKDLGMMTTVASLGALMLWDVDDGLAKTDKYQWSTDVNIKAGALMAFGLVSSGVTNDCDPAWALLAEHLESETPILKLAAVVGLGYAYAGSRREDLMENLTPIILDTTCSLECSAMAAVSLGLIFVGSGNQDIAQAIMSTLIERQQSGEGAGGLEASSFRNFFAVALGILFLGLQEASDVLGKEIQSQVTGPLGEYLKIVLETCAYAGTGDVLKVQQLLHLIAEQEGSTAGKSSGSSSEEQSETPVVVDVVSQRHCAAILGIALIAVGDDVNTDMTLRTLDHVLQYCSPSIRRVVPLAIASLHVSWPRVTVIDTLSKLTHDNDNEVAMTAILCMGLVGLGTNNSRLGGQLRQLASYYAKDPNALFLVRVSQGLVFAGKGLVSASPLHSDRQLVNPVALGSLIVLFHACLDLKSTILSNAHYMIFYLVPAIFPRMLITLNADDENLAPVPVLVRVGQAVDVVGMAGKPRNITGFQTHTTPVLLAYGERAELASEEYIAESPVLEGFVIVRKNPNYKPEVITTA
jgi:26S proteasome regulatory subunit N1